MNDSEKKKAYMDDIIMKHVSYLSQERQVLLLRNSQYQNLLETFQQYLNTMSSNLKKHPQQMECLKGQLDNQKRGIFQRLSQISESKFENIGGRSQVAQLIQNFSYCCKPHLNLISSFEDKIIRFFNQSCIKQEGNQNIFKTMKQLFQQINTISLTLVRPQGEQSTIYQTIQYQNSSLNNRYQLKKWNFVHKLSEFNIFPSKYSPMQFIFNIKFCKLIKLQIRENKYLKSNYPYQILSFQLFQFIYLNSQSLKFVVVQGVQISKFEEYIKFNRVLANNQKHRFKNQESQINKRLIEDEGQNYHVLQQRYKKDSIWISNNTKQTKDISIKVKLKYYFNREFPNISNTIMKRRTIQGKKDLIYFSQCFPKLEDIDIIVMLKQNVSCCDLPMLKQILLAFDSVKLTIENSSINKKEILSQDSFIGQLIQNILQTPKRLYINISSLQFISIFSVKQKSNLVKQKKVSKAIFVKNLRKSSKKQIAFHIQDQVAKVFYKVKSSLSQLIWNFFKEDAKFVEKTKFRIEIVEERISDQQQVINDIVRDLQPLYSCNSLSVCICSENQLKYLKKNDNLYELKVLSISKKLESFQQVFHQQRKWLKITEFIELRLYKNLQILIFENIYFAVENFLEYCPHLKRICFQQCLIKESVYVELVGNIKWLVCTKNCQIQKAQVKQQNKQKPNQNQNKKQDLSHSNPQLFYQLSNSQVFWNSNCQLLRDQQEYVNSSYIKQIFLPINPTTLTRQYIENIIHSVQITKNYQLKYITKSNYLSTAKSVQIISQRGFSFKQWNQVFLKNSGLQDKYREDKKQILKQLKDNEIYHLDLSKRNIILAIINEEKTQMPRGFNYSEKDLTAFISKDYHNLRFQLSDYKHMVLLREQKCLQILKKLTLNKSVSSISKAKDSPPFVQLIDQIIQRYPSQSQFQNIKKYIKAKAIQSYQSFKNSNDI